MIKYNEQYHVQWIKMVKDARLQLTGDCPLIEDATIAWIDDTLESLLDDVARLLKQQIQLPT